MNSAADTVLTAPARGVDARGQAIAFLIMLAIFIVAPLFIYPVFLMKILCFALFACAFNLLIGYAGLLSFGHALYFGWASYVCAHLAKVGTIKLPYWAGAWNWLVIPLPPLSPELAILGGTLARAGPHHSDLAMDDGGGATGGSSAAPADAAACPAGDPVLPASLEPPARLAALAGAVRERRRHPGRGRQQQRA